MTYATSLYALRDAARAAISSCSDTVQYPDVNRQRHREIASQIRALINEAEAEGYLAPPAHGLGNAVPEPPVGTGGGTMSAELKHEAAVTDWNRRFEHCAIPSPWQPIETAPKDGTEIILFCPQGDGTTGSTFRLTSGSWFIPPLLGTVSDPEVDEQEPPAWLSWDGGFSEETMMPTHWMPLPEPPSAEPRFCT